MKNKALIEIDNLEGILTRILLTPLYKKGRVSKKEFNNPEEVMKKNLLYLWQNDFIDEIDYNILMKKYGFNLDSSKVKPPNHSKLWGIH
ncbi:MAG: hypothetical protein KJ939_07005 [Nanoarchaeota archaeon]|nr:hypothetical protein [Nanoarchaeota archaeon]MBU4352795.1 hypothetical protein [Nanoarchaeota archaeon]MCG2719141.1 hypothetical protein [Nanoarchaeota archaeon]